MEPMAIKTGEPLHQPTSGYPNLTIIHDSGECVWCDAERWRRVDMYKFPAFASEIMADIFHQQRFIPADPS